MAMTKAEESKALAANMDMVRSIAAKFSSRGVDVEDLIQEGSIGLLRAIRNWTPEGGASLRTYASQRIRDAIQKAVGYDGYKYAEPPAETSLDQVGNDKRSLHDVIPSATFANPEDAAERNQRIQNVIVAMGSADARGVSIVCQHIVQDLPFERVAENLGISRERARQIHNDVVQFVSKRVARAD